MKRYIVYIIMVCAACALLLAACGPKPAGPAPQEPDRTPAQSAPLPEKVSGADLIRERVWRGESAGTWLPLLADVTWEELAEPVREGFDCVWEVCGDIFSYVEEQGQSLTEEEYQILLSHVQGLDGAYAEGYNGMLYDLYVLNPACFARIVLDQLPPDQQEAALGGLLYQAFRAMALALFKLPYTFSFGFSLPALGLTVAYFALIYLFALRREGKGLLGPEETVPAGVLYVPARTPLVDGERDMSDGEIQRARDRLLRRQGLVLDDPDVLSAMERPAGEYRFLPVGTGRGGGDSLVTPAQMEALDGYITAALRAAAGELAAGNIDADPWCRGEDDSCCKYCQNPLPLVRLQGGVPLRGGLRGPAAVPARAAGGAVLGVDGQTGGGWRWPLS